MSARDRGVHRDSAPCTTVKFSHASSSANAARRQLATELRTAKLRAGVVIDAEIVVVELVSNAYEHGRPDTEGNIEVTWCVHLDRVEISVLDSGEADHLQALPMNASSARGRGLAMVEAICTHWRVDHEHPGTRVTAKIAVE